MRVTPTDLPEVLAIEPEIHEDARGYFLEQWHESRYREAGIAGRFVQDNLSYSCRGTLRGLHYQIEQPQGKLVRVVAGEVLDVAVDLRRSSPHFGRWASFELSAENHRMAWIPAGFAHGFVVRSASAEFLYKTTDYYAPAYERTIVWYDPALAIDWQLDGEPILSAKDAVGATLSNAETFA